jgi:hypothetical protein
MLEKEIRKIYAADEIAPFDAIRYLLGESDGEETSKDTIECKEKVSEVVVLLSDSDSDSYSYSIPIKIETVKNSQQIANEIKKETEQKKEKEIEMRKNKFEAAQKMPISSRKAVLCGLRNKVIVTAKQNYCNQLKISSEQLENRLQISEKCRELIALLKEQNDVNEKRDRDARRSVYAMNADADEVEFDEQESELLAEGQFLTEEQKRAILLKFQNDFNDDEDEEINDEEIMDNDGLVESEVLLEELDSAKEAIEDSRRNPDDEIVHSQEKVMVNDNGNSSIEDEEDIDVVQTQMKKTINEGEIKNFDLAPLEFNRKSADDNIKDSDDENLNLVGKKLLNPSSEQFSNENTEIEIEKVDALIKKYSNKSNINTGNALYRLQLEEEERRHRFQKVVQTF